MKSEAFEKIRMSPGRSTLPSSPIEISTLVPGYPLAGAKGRTKPAQPVSAENLSVGDRQAAAQIPGEGEPDYLLVPENAILRRTRRLVVLVPEGRLDENELERRIWELAGPSGLPVLFLSLARDAESFPSVRRRLALLAAQSTHGLVRASFDAIMERNWTGAIQSRFRNGDLLVCLADHQVANGLSGRLPLGEALSKALAAPVVMFTGIQVGRPPRQSQQIKELVAWLSSLTLMVAFLVLESWTSRRLQGPVATLLLAGIVIIEILVILKVNEWIG